MDSSRDLRATNGAAWALTRLDAGLTRLLRWLRGPQPTPATSPLTLAKAAREKASLDYHVAKIAGDTRRQHETYRVYRAATAEVVRLELAR